MVLNRQLANFLSRDHFLNKSEGYIISVNAILPQDEVLIIYSALQFWHDSFASHLIIRTVSSIPIEADSPIWKAV